MIKQWLLELTQLEKIIGLFKPFNRLGMNCANHLFDKFTGSLNKVRIGLELFTANAVVTLIGSLIDKALVIEVLQEGLDVLFMARFCGSNKVLIVNV